MTESLVGNGCLPFLAALDVRSQIRLGNADCSSADSKSVSNELPRFDDLINALDRNVQTFGYVIYFEHGS